MKTKLFAISLILITAAAVAGYPVIQPVSPVVPAEQPGSNNATASATEPDRPTIEVVFVLDTTGSMSGMISAAKEKIWSIATTMASAQNAPIIRMGLVAYRDRGDQYVTRVMDLSEDLDLMYARLMDFRADGGGDGPESVNQALYDAVHEITWSQDSDTYQVIFLVGDAPAHMDYQDDVKYPVTLATAKARGILVNTIQCGEDRGVHDAWLQIAQLGSGEYFQVDQAGSALAFATPFDGELAELSASLDDTRLVYGDALEQQRAAIKAGAIEKLETMSSLASRARRAAFNATESGLRNLLGQNELVDAVTKGEVDLATIDEEDLPASLQAMPTEEREQAVRQVALKRADLQGRIQDLTTARSAYLKEKVAESGKDSLSDKIYRAVKSQSATAGLRYEAESAEH